METVNYRQDCTPRKILIVRLILAKNFLLTAFFFLAASNLAEAGHIVGGEFTYVCRGWLNNDASTNIRVYDVRINMYRDAIGQGAYFDGVVGGGNGPDGNSSAPGHITVYRGTTAFIETRIIDLGPVSDVPINLGNPCLLLTEPAAQQIGIYEFSLELPVSTQPYTLAYQRCCRNTAIRNLVTPGDIGTTYFITITPEAQTRCNASPRFNIDPPIAICVNQPFEIDLGATDRENDSLVYKFCTPVVGGGTDGLQGGNLTPTFFDDLVPQIESPPPYTNATFVFPRFSTMDQLGVGSTLNIVDSTGFLSGVPILQGTYALAVCVEEWSRDSIPILLSETKREFQLTVNLCGTQVDADLLETELDDLGRFFIRQCGPGENTIVNQSTNVDFIETYDWILEGPEGQITGRGRDLQTNINTVGTYPGLMIINRNSSASNCIDTAEFFLGVFPNLEADFEFAEPGCNDEPIEFTDLSRVLGSNIITEYVWDFQDGTANDSRRNPTHRYDEPGVFPVSLSLIDNNGCANDTSIDVTYFPTPRTIIIEPDEGFGCIPFTKEFVNLSRPISDEYIFDWEFGDGNTGDEASPTHVYEQAGVFSVYLGITSPTGCFVDTTFINLVDVRDAPTADFFWEPEEPTNLVPDVRFFDASIDAFRQRYTINNREGERIFTTGSPDFDFTLRDSSTLFITQSVTHPSGCVDTITKELRLRLINTFFVPNAFTPNADGLNDLFLPKGVLFGASAYQFRVWTRWGELIFTSTDPAIGWDGTFNNSDSPGGGYLWDAQFINVEGEQEQFKGGVTLLR